MNNYDFTEFYSENPNAGRASLIFAILAIVGMWKVFQKAGIPGWHAIIPFLNVYDLCRIGMSRNVGLFTVLSILIPIVLIVPCIRVAKSFGKGTLFGIGLFLLGGIFYPILGFGSAQYLGPRG